MDNNSLILVADDDASVLRLIRIQLSKEGFRVLTAQDGATALRLAEEQRPDAMILDVLMPDVDGYQVLRDLRARSDVPVLLLTAKTADQDKIVGLEMGADDYLPKPYNPDELTARLRAILRRGTPQQSEGMVQSGDLVIDLDRRLVTRGGRPISLTRTEWLVLHELVLNSGRVLLHAELLSRIWGPEYVNDYQYLRVWVSRLRSKLGGGRSLIKTLEGIGYAFDPKGQFPESSQQKAALKPREKDPGLTRPA